MSVVSELVDDICVLKEQLSFIVVLLNEKEAILREVCQHPPEALLPHRKGNGTGFSICRRCQGVIEEKKEKKVVDPLF